VCTQFIERCLVVSVLAERRVTEHHPEQNDAETPHITLRLFSAARGLVLRTILSDSRNDARATHLLLLLVRLTEYEDLTEYDLRRSRVRLL
jgi:hypothetical protein